jgi:hypothetical protein
MLPLGVVLLTSVSASALTILDNYTQNFDSMASTTLPTGWLANGSATVSLTATTLNSSSAGGTYKFTTAADNAIGLLNSGSFTTGKTITFVYTNSTGGTIEQLDLEWNYEKYRSGSRAWDWAFSVDAASVSAGNQSYVADAANTTVTFPPTTIAKGPFSVTGLNLLPTQSVTLTWTLNGNGGSTNGQALAIDDFKLTAQGTPGGPPPPPPSVTADVIPSPGQTLTYSFTGFNASGFAAAPAAGQLDSDNWKVNGLSDSAMNFGDSKATGDFARGASTGGVVTGGVYAFDHGGGDVGLGVQPAGSDFAPGSFELRLQNTTGGIVDALSVAYDAWVFNNEARANSLNFSFSIDGVNFTAVPGADLTSIEAPDTLGWVKFPRAISLAGLALPNNGFLFFRWTGADVSGAGSRDEFAIDNLRITNGVTAIVVPEPASLALLGLSALALLRRRRHA